MRYRTERGIPVFAFTGYSGTGKTTFLERLIFKFTEKGYKIGVIKHDAHSFQLDKEGKDTWRFKEAGALSVGILNDSMAGLIEYRFIAIEDILNKMENLDIIFLEGYHNTDFPIFSLSRKATGKGFRIPNEKAFGLISDERVELEKPWFDILDIDGVLEFIISNI